MTDTTQTESQKIADLLNTAASIIDAGRPPVKCLYREAADHIVGLEAEIDRLKAAKCVVPSDWIVLPKVATEGMLVALIRGSFCSVTSQSRKDFTQGISAYLAAAPKVPGVVEAHFPNC